MNIGNARVSSQHQNLEMQLDALTSADCIEIFQEKMTGKRKDRPALEEMLKVLRKGDRVVVYKLVRIGRSLIHLIELVEHFNEIGVDFVSLHENIDTSTPAGRLFFHMMAALAEFEREMIVERTQTGLAGARARGKNGGRPKVEENQIEKALKLYDSKTYSIKEITALTGISHQTLYRYLKKRNQNQE